MAHTLREFLEGRTAAPVRALERAMQAAAEDLAFEQARVLRDRLALVSWLHERVQHFHANVDRLTFVYTALGPDDSEWVYLVRRGTVRAEVRAPRTAQQLQSLVKLQQRIFDGPDPQGADIPTHDLDEFYLVASWFRRRPLEKQRTRAPFTPRS
jgi:excinuclease UvrABC nuclease subunit